MITRCRVDLAFDQSGAPRFQFTDKLVRRSLAAIARDRPQGPVVPLSAHGRTGIGGDRRRIAEIAGLPANRGLDALVRHHAAQDQVPRAEVAEDIIDIGRDEHAGRGLGDDDLVIIALRSASRLC